MINARFCWSEIRVICTYSSVACVNVLLGIGSVVIKEGNLQNWSS